MASSSKTCGSRIAEPKLSKEALESCKELQEDELLALEVSNIFKYICHISLNITAFRLSMNRTFPIPSMIEDDSSSRSRLKPTFSAREL